MSQYKTCTKCGQTKPLDAYGKHKGCRYGLRSDCKTCRNASNKAYRKANPDYQKAYCEANREKRADYAKTYREANRDKATAYSKQWVNANPERSAAYRESHRAKSAATTRAWQRANPERVNLNNNKRRARKLTNGVWQVTSKEWKRLRAAPCLYCGGKSQHIDHIIPLSRGGADSIGNLTGACASCNLSKGSKFIMEWKIRGGK